MFMKGDRMQQRMAHRRMGLSIAAMFFLCTIITFTQADARQASLKTELRNNGISIKLVKLDRTDGFMFGFSFTGLHKQSFVIAPGLDSMLLVVADGQEMILQPDQTGNLQIIQATGGYPTLLCMVPVIATFFSNLILCEPAVWSCQVKLFVDLVYDLNNCLLYATREMGK